MEFPYHSRYMGTHVVFPNVVVELINRLSTGYWENTHITAERAMEDYLLEME